jgi:hypothetical protein
MLERRAKVGWAVSVVATEESRALSGEITQWIGSPRRMAKGRPPGSTLCNPTVTTTDLHKASGLREGLGKTESEGFKMVE